MLRTKVSYVIDAPIADVWKVIRPFDSLSVWHPFVDQCVIENGLPSDKVGSIRRITNAAGGIIRETLLALDDLEHRIAYDILESDMPVSNYIATLTLQPVTEGNTTFAVWTVECDTPADQHDMMMGKLHGIFSSGLGNIKSVISG